MAKAVKGLMGAISLTVTIFVVLLVSGIYIALDAAPTFTLGGESAIASNASSGHTGN